MSSIVKNIDSINKLLADVSYKNWTFKVREGSGGFILSVIPDMGTLTEVERVELRFKKPLAIKEWYISRFATDTEVVRTAYKAVMFIEMFIVEHAQFIDLDTFTEMTLDTELGDKERTAIMLVSFKYKNWKVRTEERDGGLMVQIIFEAADNDNPEVVEEQHCRKFIYNYESGLNELFLTLQYAVKTAEEHECNEQFTYKGKQIYNPHMDLDAIVEFINTNEFDHR